MKNRLINPDLKRKQVRKNLKEDFDLSFIKDINFIHTINLSQEDMIYHYFSRRLRFPTYYFSHLHNCPQAIIDYEASKGIGTGNVRRASLFVLEHLLRETEPQLNGRWYKYKILYEIGTASNSTFQMRIKCYHLMVEVLRGLLSKPYQEDHYLKTEISNLRITLRELRHEFSHLMNPESFGLFNLLEGDSLYE